MLRNYIKIAIRNLYKQKVYSFINIFGLAIGVACCLLIGLYVQNEWSYDTFHSKSDRIYRAWTEMTAEDGRSIQSASTPVALGDALREHIPEVEQVTYIYSFNNLVQTADRPDAHSEHIEVVSQDFFRIFDFNLLSGDALSVFNSPSSVVLTEETAGRLFGDSNPMYKSLSIRLGSTFHEFTVTGVIEEAPPNSSLEYNILMPFENLDQLIDERGRNSWFRRAGSTFVLLRENANLSELDPKLQSMIQGVLGEERYLNTKYTIGLQPLPDIYLNTSFSGSLASVSDPAYSYILTVIALFILLIACVNFMTLSISKSASRAREVGVRKTIGAVRRHLMCQFWGEALLITVLAMVVGVCFAELLLPLFNDLSGTALAFSFTFKTVLMLMALAIAISLVAGIYPALILSGFRPVEIMKGRLRFSAGKSLFRQIMVVIQFALSIALILGTIIVRQQLNYIQSKNLGYQKNQIVVLESGLSAGPQVPLEEVIQAGLRRKGLLQGELHSVPEVEHIAISVFSPVQTGGWLNLGFKDNQGQQHGFHGNVVDAYFLTTLDIQLMEGRNFSEENSSDNRRAMIVNQALVDYFGWENAIGQRLPGPGFEEHKIIGVVENFHYESLHTPVEPLALAMTPSVLLSGINHMTTRSSQIPRISIKFNTANLEHTITSIQNAWETVAPDTPFEFTFVDQALDAQYRQEQRLSRIVTTGAVFAIIIACLGLFGLASLMVMRRTKEIGVRKILGATSPSIILLINKEFTRLIIIAFGIAVPVAWYIMNSWLQGFAYRINISVGTILLAGILALAVAWLTVSYQSIRATLINPVDSLRSE